MKMYSAKEAPPGVEEREFPMMIGHKSASVKIYRHPNRGVESYTISYHSEGARQKQMRRDFIAAFTLAQHMALKIGDGASSVLTLDGRDRFIYERSTQLATQTGMELDVLVARAVEAVKIAGGPELLVEAARLYEAQHRGVVQKVVADVVAELIQDRRSRGRSELYLRDLRVRLEQRFASAFKVPISSITSRDIEVFLNAVKGGPRTKKNFLTAIGTLFAFAKRRGYLPQIHPGISKVEFDAEVVVDIQIFTAEDMDQSGHPIQQAVETDRDTMEAQRLEAFVYFIPGRQNRQSGKGCTRGGKLRCRYSLQLSQNGDEGQGQPVVLHQTIQRCHHRPNAKSQRKQRNGPTRGIVATRILE